MIANDKYFKHGKYFFTRELGTVIRPPIPPQIIAHIFKIMLLNDNPPAYNLNVFQKLMSAAPRGG